MKRCGYTLPEITVALLLFTVGVLVTLQLIVTSGEAATSSDSRARAVRDTDALLRRLSTELVQSTARVDPGLPPDESQRLWILSDGVRFQRVVGYTLDPQGEALQEWSIPVSYRWDSGKGVITREPEGGKTTIVARHVTAFQTATNAIGQVVVSIESTVGHEGRGTRAGHRRTIRVTPRNDLR